MTATTVRIGTRGSPLALAQAREVRARLIAAWPELDEDLSIAGLMAGVDWQSA